VSLVAILVAASLVAPAAVQAAESILYDPVQRTLIVIGTDVADSVEIVPLDHTRILVSMASSGIIQAAEYEVEEVAGIAVLGGAGEDQIANLTIRPLSAWGEDGSDTILGGSADDFLAGGPGDDQLRGSAGHDLLDGGEGDDVMIGDTGDDSLYGGQGVDLVSGSSGRDLLVGDLDDDVLAGDEDDDIAFGGDGDDFIKGGSGTDGIDGGPGADAVSGEDGDDVLSGAEGNDQLRGGAGGDLLTGGEGDDSLDGEGEDDVLDGGEGDDILAGYDGADHLSGDTGNDGLDGGFGDDLLFAGPGSDTLVGGDGNDLLQGGDGDDYLMGAGGGDLLYGEEGNDTIDGDLIDPALDGGPGENRLSADRHPVRFGIVANPANDPNSTEEDVFRAFEKARTVASQISVFLSFRAQSRLPKLLLLLPKIAEFGMRSLIQFDVQILGEPNPPSDLPQTFTAPEVRTLFLDNIRRIAEQRPDTLVIAPEVNILYWVDRAEFDAFASLYKEAYRVVKQISPTTDVGVSFHYTLFRGCEQFAIVDALGPRDFLGFTSYPIWMLDEGILDSVEDYPPEWWSWIRWAYPTERILLTELGFPNSRQSTPEAQAAFVRRLPELFAGLRPESVNWTLLSNVTFFRLEELPKEQLDFLLDVGVDGHLLFGRLNNIGLHSHLGTPLPSWFEAIKLKLDWPSGPVVGTPSPLGVTPQPVEDLPEICGRYGGTSPQIPREATPARQVPGLRPR
jgi:Ca2+-binding RTX toxin-like protein